MSAFDLVAERLDTSQPALYGTLEGPEAFIDTWMSKVEGAFGRAGFYGGVDVASYDDPTEAVNDLPPKQRPIVNAVRRMWLARFNPNQDEFREDDGSSGSDVASEFPWRHPERANR